MPLAGAWRAGLLVGELGCLVRAVCAENLVRFDLTTESLDVGRDGRADAIAHDWVIEKAIIGGFLYRRGYHPRPLE
jgi:hypothetical protein